MLRITIALCLLAGAAFGQTLADGFRELGRIEAMVNGTPTTFIIPFDEKRGSGLARDREIMGKRSINFVGMTLKEDGTPSSPQLQLTFFLRDGVADLLSIEIFDSGFDTPLVAEPQLGRKEITSIAEAGAGELEGTFEGELVRLTGYAKGEPKVVEGEAPVSVSGTFTVAIPQD